MGTTRTSVARARRIRVVAALGAGVLALAGCTSQSVAERVGGQLPDLAEYGYEQFECGTGVTIGELFKAPEEPYRAQCWRGAKDDPFTWVADDLRTALVQATGGVDASSVACPKDVLNETAGVACRAVYVGTEGDDVLVRVIVTLPDIDAVIAKVPEDPTPDDVVNALYGADVEVLIGTEPIPEAASQS